MKTLWENIGKTQPEDKYIRVDMETPEQSSTPYEDIFGVNKLLPQMSILQLSDVAKKKTFKGNKGKALIVSDNEQYVDFGDVAWAWNVTPITLTYSANLTVDLWYNLNYILVLTWDCELTLTNIIPWCVYQFLIIQDNVWWHALNIMHPCYYIQWYNQDTTANGHSKLIVDYIDANYYAAINRFQQKFITITWEDYNWTTLLTQQSPLWWTPEYTWTTPTRTWYEFIWWSPEPEPVLVDTTYTAQYVRAWLPWIFWNKTWWWISITSDWTNWITLQDENVGANNDWEWTWDSWYWYNWTDVLWITPPAWYHIAKVSELNSIVNMWIAVWAWWAKWWGKLWEYLKMGRPWMSVPWMWVMFSWEIWSYYCLNDLDNERYHLQYDVFNDTTNIEITNWWTNIWRKVRLIKDTPVPADNTWTRIY